MGKVGLQGLASAPLPIKTRTATMYMAWHRRDQLGPAHKWLRRRIEMQVAEIL